MTSNASSSDPASLTDPEPQRPQAGPLPTKRGEIGFQEHLHGHLHDSRSSSPTTELPSRHPADRGASPEENDTSSSSPHPDPPTTTNHNPPSTSSTSSPPNPISSQKTHRFFGIFKGGKGSSIGGLDLSTLLAFILQLIILGGTVAIWVLTSKRLGKGLISNSIFIHAIFAVASVGQLLFLERRLYRLRAERYNYLHPGEILPSSRLRQMSSNPVIAFSPWNRPPLPTYAAALAQSGAGTGDVEDHLIAAPPPPAYGNTRGSILLLSGFLRESLRGQRPSSGQSSVSGREGGNGDRPVSHVGRGSHDEFVEDAERARRLDETLARLERPASRSSRASRGSRTSFA